MDRPKPVHVDAIPASLGAKPPGDAIVLFDGGSLAQWQWDENSSWFVDQGVLQAKGDSPSLLRTRQNFADVQLHLEFRTPGPPGSEDQKRGNSGVFFNGRFEVQILDNWDNVTYADGWLGGTFGQKPPMVDASQPPGQWQAYDIVFRAPRFKGKRLTRQASVTVFLNSVVVLLDEPFLGETAAADPRPSYSVQESEGPLAIQEHGDTTGKVQFRNIWIRPLSLE
jgi:hypothetical protein